MFVFLLSDDINFLHLLFRFPPFLPPTRLYNSNHLSIIQNFVCYAEKPATVALLVDGMSWPKIGATHCTAQLGLQDSRVGSLSSRMTRHTNQD